MNNTLYPLKFTPILKSKIWGGNKLKTVLNKTSELQDVGESWEISDVEGDTSVVSNGPLKGQSLKDILRLYTSDLLGEKNYKVFKDKFPLLIKFIDAREDLSVQLHPNDELSAKRHSSFGKTEMWHVMQADDDAKLIVGFNQDVDKDQYIQAVEDKSLIELLNFENVTTGDTYFIEVGRIHAIGSGVLLAEIQQTSDITYRIYDWDRVDDQGNSRELHNDLAIDAINFNMPDNFNVSYSKEENTSNRMVSCQYFNTSYLYVTDDINKENNKDSFFIYICVEGEAAISGNGFSESLVAGQTVLLPAAVKNYKISSKNAKLLEVYV